MLGERTMFAGGAQPGRWRQHAAPVAVDAVAVDKVCACKSLMQVSSSKYLSLQAAVCAWAVAWAVARSVESSMHVVCSAYAG